MAEDRAAGSMPGLTGGGRRAEVWTAAGLAGFVGLFAVGSLLIGHDALVEPLGRLSPAVISGMLGLSLVNYLLRGWRWDLFGRALGVAVPPLRNQLYYFSGFALTMTPGKIGEALRLWLLHRGHGWPYHRTVGILVADRLSDAAAIILLALLGAAGYSGHLWLIWPVVLATVAVSWLIARPRLLLRLVRLAYGAVGRRPRLFARVRTAVRRTSHLVTSSVALPALALSLIGWLAEIAAFHWLLHELGIAQGWPASAVIFAVSALVGTAAMLPGGLGGTEAAMVALLVAEGAAPGVALTATVIIRVTTLWFAVALGLLALPLALRLVGRAAPGTMREVRL